MPIIGVDWEGQSPTIFSNLNNSLLTYNQREILSLGKEMYDRLGEDFAKISGANGPNNVKSALRWVARTSLQVYL